MYIGQIVRIKCVNVLTYDEVEIRPCEKLNLIIGANGSGKSTLLSAIILGLGGNPAIVGRATELKKYVKMGQSKATIEIELYNPEGNDIIVRTFNIRNQSQFQVNGRDSSVDRVQKLMKKYNIQINNLCQILPQEKLEQFAKMNDHQRLEGTIKTVGNQKLADDLNELKNSKIKEETVTRKLITLKRHLADVTKKRDDLGIEVRINKEKEFLVDTLKLLNQRRFWQFYYHLKETVAKVNATLMDRKKVCENMVHLLKKSKLTLQKSLSDVHLQNKTIENINNQSLQLIKEVKEKQNEINDLTEQINDIKSEFKNKMKKIQSQKNDVHQLKETIERLTEQISNASEVSNEIEYTENLIRDQKQKVREIAYNKDYKESELRQAIENRNYVNNKLNKLNDVVDYKLNILRKNYIDIYEAVKWLEDEKSKNRFRGRVYGPMFLNLTVGDVNHAKFVEMCIGNRDLLAFMCEYKEDTTTLLVELKEKRDLKVNVVSAVNIDRSALIPKYPIESLKQFGFHSYVLDLIEGPDLIVSFLALNYNLHNIPVGNQYTYTVVDQIPNDIRVFLTDKLRFNISIATMTKLTIQSISEIRDARLLKVNESTNDYDNLRAQKEELDVLIKETQQAVDTLNINVTKGDDDVRKLENKLKDLNSQNNAQKRLRETLKSKNRELHRLENDVIDVDVEKNKCNLNVKLTLSKIYNKYFELSNSFQQLTECYTRLQIKKLDKEQCEKIDRQNLQITNEFVSAIKQETRSLHELEMKKKKLAKLTNFAHRFALKKTGGIDPTSNRFKRRKYFLKLNSNVIVLSRMVNKMQAKINCMGGNDRGFQIITEYRKYAREVVSLEKKIQKKEEGFREFKQRIVEIKQNWIPEVEKLVSTINENFGRFFANMNCAGEVSLYKGASEDDYNNYGIHIRVKFREHGDLRILNAHTQSGGERAVSVAIYLLSMQELTSVPFRCIDEINQGMDADNERRIFNLLTKATDDQCETQYFLLTPKLLPKLEFTSSMQIFCPFNGIGSISHSKLPEKYICDTISCSQQSRQLRRSSRLPSPKPSTSRQNY